MVPELTVAAPGLVVVVVMIMDVMIHIAVLKLAQVVVLVIIAREFYPNSSVPSTKVR